MPAPSNPRELLQRATARPWSEHGNTISDAAGKLIGELWDDDTWEPDLALTLRAVNNYERLLEIESAARAYHRARTSDPSGLQSSTSGVGFTFDALERSLSIPEAGR